LGVDGEHPNRGGSEKMATKFLAATTDAIKAVSWRRALTASIAALQPQAPEFVDPGSDRYGDHVFD